MKIGPLAFFERMHSNGKPINSFVLAALHWKSSITWRWSLSWSPWYRQGNQGCTFRRAYPGRGFNFAAHLNSRLLGHFSLVTQPNMFRSNAARISIATATPGDAAKGE